MEPCRIGACLPRKFDSDKVFVKDHICSIKYCELFCATEKLGEL